MADPSRIRAPVRPADPAAIAEAAALIRAGALVAFPTETVYGLGADATDDRAVAAVFAAKERPEFNPLIVHLPDAARAEALASFDDRARAVAARFWPGALTLVLPRAAGCPVSLLASAGLDTLALRVPDHAIARAFLEACGRPVVAPSANPSGGISPTTARHVADGLGDRVAMILDGGPCRIGLESTVLDLSGPEPVLLRPGGVTAEALAALLGPLAVPAPFDESGTAARLSPGMLARHYAPGKPVRLNARSARPGEGLLGFGPAAPAGTTHNLSPTGDLAEAAANLFRMLRELDADPCTGIAVMPIPDEGLGHAIGDRLRRAAVPA